MNKKVIIISYYRWWNKRQKFFAEWFEKRGYTVNYCTADFDHIRKKYTNGEIIPSNTKMIHVPEYKSNFSLRRIISNYFFSKEVTKYLEKENPDIILCIIPSNFLGISLKKYKSKNKNCKIMIDIIDLWPESLPFNSIVKNLLFIPLNIWKKIRNLAFHVADYVIFECKYYYKRISKEYNLRNFEILYLQQKDFKINNNLKRDISTVKFLYLGSINNIIDIKTIVNLLHEINKKKSVELHIIGCGTSQEKFIKSAQKYNIKTYFYGPIFDDIEKNKIMEQCHFGINIFKKNVAVGLTTKSIDYLSLGLPIINAIPEDSLELIQNYHAGINIDSKNIKKSADLIIDSLSEYSNLCFGAQKLFIEELSEKGFLIKMNRILEQFLNN